MSEKNNFNKKKYKKIKHLEKQLDEKQDAVNISNQRTDKIPVIAIDNYNNTLKEYDSIYAASKDLQINSDIIIYSCKNMHKPKKRYITETSPYSFGNFRKLSLYNGFMPI